MIRTAALRRPSPPRAAFARALAAAALGLLAAVLPGVAAAQEASRAALRVTVQGREVVLPLPHDYCDLDPGQPRDRALLGALDVLAGGARPLRRFAICSDLALWRAREDAEPVEVVQYLAPSAPPASRDSREAALEDLASGKDAATVEELTVRTGRSGVPADLADGRPVVLGVVEQDDRGLHVAGFARAAIDGRRVDWATMTSTTLANGAPVVVLVAYPFDREAPPWAWMLDDQRDAVERVLGANGEEDRRFERRPRPEPGERDAEEEPMPDRPRRADFMDRRAGEIAVALLGGGALMLCVGLVGGRLVRRREVL